ncbi:hypothetical protein BLAT2472_30531 [Burkholderia latens]
MRRLSARVVAQAGIAFLAATPSAVFFIVRATLHPPSVFSAESQRRGVTLPPRFFHHPLG